MTPFLFGALFMTSLSPLFQGHEEVSNPHLVSSLYRSISSVEKAEENEDDKAKEEADEKAELTADEKKQQELCENKQKLQDLKDEVAKIEEEKDRVAKIIAEMEEDDKKDKEEEKVIASESDITNLLLSQLLMNQIYMTQMLSTSMTTQATASSFDASNPLGYVELSSPFRNLSTDQLSNYASLALSHRVQRQMNSSSYWSPQFDSNGDLTNSMFGSNINQTIYGNQQYNPYQSNQNYGTQRNTASSVFY